MPGRGQIVFGRRPTEEKTVSKLLRVKLEVTTSDGVELIDWESGEALAKLVAEPIDLKTVVEMCVRELEAQAHLRQTATARQGASK